MHLDRRLHLPNFETHYKETIDCVSSRWEITFSNIYIITLLVNGW